MSEDANSDTIRTEILGEKQSKETKYLHNELLKFVNNMETQPRLGYEKKKTFELKQILPSD